MPKIAEKNALLLIGNLTLLTSLVILLYLFLIHIILLLDPSHRYLDPEVFDISYLRILFSLVLLLTTVSWLISIFFKETKIVSPLNLRAEKTILALLTAFFLTVFFKSTFNFLGFFQYPFFLLGIGFFYFLIVQISQLYLSFKFTNLKSQLTNLFSKQIVVQKENLGLHRVFLIALTLISCYLIAVSFFSIGDIFSSYFKEKIYAKNPYHQQLYIKEIIPQMALHASRVRIVGYNLGWRSNLDKRYRVMTDYGPIQLVEEWTNDHIDITVPLGTRVGKRQLWIERPDDNPNQQPIEKSNARDLEVFSRFVFYPDIGDTKIEKFIKIIKRILFFNIKILNHSLFKNYE